MPLLSMLSSVRCVNFCSQLGQVVRFTLSMSSVRTVWPMCVITPRLQSSMLQSDMLKLARTCSCRRAVGILVNRALVKVRDLRVEADPSNAPSSTVVMGLLSKVMDSRLTGKLPADIVVMKLICE